ncbi:MAG: DUF3795 domain-containing protein [Candidatus Hermodarchaeota archaeon]
MNIDEYSYGVCGVYCGQCPSGNGRIKTLAHELLRATADLTSDTPDYEIKEFNVTEFRKGLEWFHKSPCCPTCLNITEPWCEVLKCEQVKRLKSCFLCGEFLTCSHLEYHRKRYPFIIDHYRRVQEIGLKQHLEEEKKRAQEGISLIDLRTY